MIRSSPQPYSVWLHALVLCAGVQSIGCAGLGYVGSARDLDPDALDTEPGWIGVHGVPMYRQQADHDCGTTALAMVLRYWDERIPVSHLVERPADEQVSAAELRRLARQAGFSAFVVEGTVHDLANEAKAGRPVIVGVAKPTATGHVAHYEVVVGMHPETHRIATIDPAEGLRSNTFDGFLEEWLPTGSVLVVVLPVEPEPDAASEPSDEATDARPPPAPRAAAQPPRR